MLITPLITLLWSVGRTQANETRDALAKAVYDRLFRWIVESMNSRIVNPDAAK